MENCIFCKIVKNNFTNMKTNKDDIIFRNEWITIFLASDGWENNLGHLLIIPNKHFENIYEISDDYLQKIAVYSKKCACLLKKVYKCDGITIRQNNEHYGGQDVFHYHMHIFPRYRNDNFNSTNRKNISPNVRESFAKRLKSFLLTHETFFND